MEIKLVTLAKGSKFLILRNEKLVSDFETLLILFLLRTDINDHLKYIIDIIKLEGHVFPWLFIQS